MAGANGATLKTGIAFLIRMSADLPKKNETVLKTFFKCRFGWWSNKL
jgi:hypothetical protein